MRAAEVLELMLNKVFLIVGHLYRDLCGRYTGGE